MALPKSNPFKKIKGKVPPKPMIAKKGTKKALYPTKKK